MSTQKKVNETAKQGINGVNEAANQPTPKKRRRGISNETRSVSRLKFSHTDITRYKVFIGNINVMMKWVTIGADTNGSPSFIGKAVPQLVVEFSSLHENVVDKRFNNRTIWARESNVDNIPGGSKYRFIEADFSFMKHLLEVIVLKGRPLTEAEEEALELGYVDFDEEGAYEPVEVDDVIKAWQVLFENFIKIIETSGEGGKSALLDKNGKQKMFYAKMIRYYKDKGEWVPAGYGSDEGNLVFPTFIGEGIFEEAVLDAQKQPVPPKHLKLDETREAVAPMNVSRKKPNMATAPGIGGIPVGAGTIPQGGFVPGAPSMPGAPAAGAFDGAFNGGGQEEDLPF